MEYSHHIDLDLCNITSSNYVMLLLSGGFRPSQSPLTRPGYSSHAADIHVFICFTYLFAKSPLRNYFVGILLLVRIKTGLLSHYGSMFNHNV